MCRLVYAQFMFNLFRPPKSYYQINKLIGRLTWLTDQVKITLFSVNKKLPVKRSRDPIGRWTLDTLPKRKRYPNLSYSRMVYIRRSTLRDSK